MTSEQYRRALKKVDLSIVGAGRFFGASARAGQRWAADGPPPTVVLCLRLMLALRMTAADVLSTIEKK